MHDDDHQDDQPEETYAGPEREDFWVEGNAGWLMHHIAIAQAAYGPLVKNKTAEVRPKDPSKRPYTFSYADLEAVFAAAAPGLEKAELGLVQLLTHVGPSWRLTSILGGLHGCLVSVVEFADPQNDQALGSRVTYLKRYVAQALLRMAADDDDDGNASSGNEVTGQSRKPPKTKSSSQPTKPQEAPKEAPKEAGSRASSATMSDLLEAFNRSKVPAGMARGKLALDVAGCALNEMTEEGAKKLIAHLKAQREAE